MNSDLIFQNIISSLSNIGIDFNISDSDDMSLSSLIEDSITYIRFIVELEEELSISLPDHILIDSELTISSLVEVISNLVQEDTSSLEPEF